MNQYDPPVALHRLLDYVRSSYHPAFQRFHCLTVVDRRLLFIPPSYLHAFLRNDVDDVNNTLGIAIKKCG